MKARSKLLCEHSDGNLLVDGVIFGKQEPDARQKATVQYAVPWVRT